MKNIIVILIFIIANQLNAQEKVQKIVEFNFVNDTLNNRIVKTFEYDKNGNLIEEKLNNFKPLNSKYRYSETRIYKYKKGKLTTLYRINRPNKDSITVEYSHKKRSTKIRTKERITQTKLIDSIANKYGYGSENGCIVPPEAIEFYKTWVERENKKVFLKDNKKVKEKVFFDYRTNPYNLIYTYDNNSRIIKITQISRITDKINWTENYSYDENLTTRKRKYFITYWDKIPPTEIEKTFLNKKGKPIKKVLTNSKDFQNGIIKFYYKNGNLSSKKLFDQEENLIREHKFHY